MTEPYQSHAIAEGIKGARDSDDFYTRTRILASLSSYLNEPTRSQVLQDAVDSMFAAAQDVAQTSENSDNQEGNIADETFSDAIAQEGGPQNVQLDWLTDLAPYLTAPILREAIVRARELTDEIVRATTLSRLLAALAGLLPLGAERDALFYEALELAFLNPFFPERGGDGAPEDPEGVPISPERVKQLWAQLSPDEQIQITGEFLSVIGGRLGGPATQAANTELDRLERSKAGRTSTPNQSAAISPTSLSENPILVVEQRQSAPDRRSSTHAVTTATPRYLQSRFPERVQLGERLPLQIRVSGEMGDGPSSLLRDFTVPLDGLELILILHAPDFRIYSQRTQRLHLPLTGNSNWTLWEIEPFANGTFPISVSAYNGAAYLGEITLSVKVTESLTRTESAEVERRTALATRDAGLGEATLSIRYDAREQVFRYHFLFPQEKIRSYAVGDFHA